MKLFIKTIFSVLFVALLFSCAQIAPLTGGSKDVLPPKLTEASPKNQSTNFVGRKIYLKFNEYVQLKDIFNQFIITPQVKEQPDIVVKGKSIEITFKEPLQKETTYKLYFGSAIADITEGNSVSNFEYILSTGSKIDTLSLRGNVIDAFTLRGQKDVLVCLYQNKNDSIIYTSKPDYVAKTEIDGSYKISNIKAETYKAVAIGDNNKNYLYDVGETIGFTETGIALDSSGTCNFKIFKEKSKKVFVKKVEHSFPEKVILVFNTGIKNISDIFVMNTQKNLITDYKVKANRSLDSVWFYFKSIPSDSIYIKHRYATDSSWVLFQTKEEIENQFKRKRLPLETKAVGILNETLPYFAPCVLHTSFMIDKIVPAKFLIIENDKKTDSLKESDLKVVEDSVYVLKKWKEDHEYKLQLLPGAITDAYARVNDTLTFKFKTNNKSDYGILNITSKLPYSRFIIQLYNSANNCAYEKLVEAINTKDIRFINIIPDTYKVKIIVDTNNDNAFSVGDYFNKTQAEHVFIYKQEIKIVADWESEFIIDKTE